MEEGGTYTSSFESAAKELVAKIARVEKRVVNFILITFLNLYENGRNELSYTVPNSPRKSNCFIYPPQCHLQPLSESWIHIQL